ncbi:branched-chain amino acid ABC transporter permease [Pseudolysinimonas yzui]|uniref:Branched-chain amino acid ABC transporter permease n=1 Tax=Pseudolysinimonas yzui TaxID=2708254 RepID=A0A8J3GP29_9MICO|nr:branched-chain amino acid ABC transporter permease [Pseudolysinimonas yzui]GHF09824.1 branched-chain amino acid ABC transporter permease [Pseudolysinimonas yzui]
MKSLTRLTTNRWVRLAIGVAVAALLIVLPLISSKFVNYQLSLMAVFAVAILGLNIVMGYTGQVSLGQSAFLGLGAYIAAYGVTEGWPIPLIFLLCAVVPAIVGLIIALAAARLRGLALAMVTIALPIIGIPLAKRFREFTGGSQGTTVRWLSAPEWNEGFLENDQWRYYVVVIIAALMFLLARNLVRGRMGRAFRIVKENEAVAISIGISPYRYKVLAFTIASLFGGVAGFLYLGVVQYTSPETMSFHTSINMVAAMVIGGSASILGTIFAAIYFVLVPNLANEINPSLTALFSGAILLAVLFLVPGGVVSLPRRIAQVLRSLRRRGNAPARDAETPQNPSDGALAPTATGPKSTEKNRKRQGQ